MKAVARPVRMALQRIGFGSGSLTGSLRWRRGLLLAALVASAAAAVFLAIFSRPSDAFLWLSDPYSTPSSRIADSLSSVNFSPTSLPGFVSRPNFSASAVTPVLLPVLGPSSSLDYDLDDAEVDRIDSGPGSKETALWTGVMNSTDANLPSLSVENHPSKLESSKSGTPGLREPPLSLQNELRMPMPLTFTDQQLIYAKGEINRAPVIYDDPDLFAPLFLNVSVFKRAINTPFLHSFTSAGKQTFESAEHQQRKAMGIIEEEAMDKLSLALKELELIQQAKEYDFNNRRHRENDRKSYFQDKAPEVRESRQALWRTHNTLQDTFRKIRQAPP